MKLQNEIIWSEIKKGNQFTVVVRSYDYDDDEDPVKLFQANQVELIEYLKAYFDFDSSDFPSEEAFLDYAESELNGDGYDYVAIYLVA